MSFLHRFAPPQVILAASIPFVGYALAFMYERGYTGRYGIPTWMTRDTPMQALVASVIAAALVAATPFIARTFSRLTSQWILRLVLAPLAALAVAVWAASETQWVMGPHLLIPVALIAGFGGFAALRIHRSIVTPLLGNNGGAWMERLRGHALRSEPRAMPAFAWLGHRVRWTLAILVVALFSAHWVGNYKSRNERSFLVSSSAPTCVAVRKNADGLICAITDLTRRRVLPQLRVMPPAAAAKEKLTVANLSPLRSPLDADRKLFAAPRPAGTMGTVYTGRRDAPVTQAGQPRAVTAAKKPTATKKATTKKKTTGDEGRLPLFASGVLREPGRPERLLKEVVLRGQGDTPRVPVSRDRARVLVPAIGREGDHPCSELGRLFIERRRGCARVGYVEEHDVWPDPPQRFPAALVGVGEHR
jgi:hypothetical protein